MPGNSNLVQVSPNEFIRRNPGETDADVKRRWSQDNAKYAADRERGARALQRQENLDRQVMSPPAFNKKWGNKVISSSGTGYGSTRK